MPNRGLLSVFHRLLRRVSAPAAGEVSDAELLNRFITQRDEAAFELLLWRHGPMVFSLCRRRLNEDDAEDAFQATFFVLARKARSLRNNEALASWLYKVAYRIACRAQARVSPRTNRPEALGNVCVAGHETEVIRRDVAGVVDDEVAQLPESYRRPIVLCYFEGKTNEEAARLLGCPQGTLSARLARARDRLRIRLERRGWAISSAALAGVFANQAVAETVGVQLVRTTLQAAVSFAAGTAATGVSLKAVTLTEGVLRAMFVQKIKLVAGVIFAITLIGTGAGWVMHQALAGGGNENTLVVSEAPFQGAPKKPDPAAQSEPKAEIAALRAEIAQLRAELESAQKAIKYLKDALGARVPPHPTEPTYRGKTLSLWLQQLNDGDAAFRKDAVIALGYLAQRKEDLVPVLVDSLKDADVSVRKEAVVALGRFLKRKRDLIPVFVGMLNDEGRDQNIDGISSSAAAQAGYTLANTLGSDAVQVLVDVLADKKSMQARRVAIVVLRDMELDAKVILPVFIRVLNDEDRLIRGAATAAISKYGSEAKTALPALVKALEMELPAMKAHAMKLREGFPKGVIQRPPETLAKLASLRGDPAAASFLLYAILKLDPTLEETLEADANLAAIVPSDRPILRGTQTPRDPMEIVALWQKAVDILKKKYPPQK